ncbi:ABC transporter substrate-binding protein [Rhodococcus qingshengii]|uniref:ABC transporter substrate-binding protein n=1 Tax=Rhodococcus qingshengii TaxID=334542 RepID=UPI00237D25C7|nr:ABC transporter substrate-binding protein [Rhodococcus qingshengii]WCT05752.1 ABC transporter substrate-binding protein [Rhodococcus qingshengii]
MKSRLIAPLAATAVVGLIISGCSTSTDSSTASPGVTKDTIKIGALTDLSGPFSASGKVQINAARAYWDDVNAAGGVCGRNVELNVQDHGYDPQKAVSQYRAMANDIVGLQQVLGTPIVQALLPTVTQANMYTGGVGWASVALGNKVAQVPGEPYPVDIANAVDYMVSDLGVSKGSTIGAVYLKGDISADVKLGLEAAATSNDLTLVEREVAPPDTDFSAIVASMKQAKVDGVMLSVSPGQFGAVVNQLRANGLDVPVIGQHFAWNPAILKGLASDVIEDNVFVVSPVAPYAADLPGVKEAARSYEDAQPNGEKDWGAIYGYGMADLMHQALEGTCDNLTREGLVAAMRDQTSIDTGGIFVGELSFKDPFQPATLSSYISRVDADLPGGLQLIGTTEGPSAAGISFPKAP